MKSKIFRIIAITLLVTLVYTYPFAWILAGGIGESRVSIALMTEGIGKGLDPKGGYFDINELKDEELLNRAIWDMGMQNSMTATELAQMIRIIPHVQGNALSNLTATAGFGSVAAIYERQVYPNQFDIFLADGGLPSPAETNALMESIMESYRDYLEESYMGVVPVNEYDEAYFSKIDYPEILRIINQQISLLCYYIDEYVSRLPEFRSYTGLAFSDVLEQARLIQSVELRDMRSLVSWYFVTKNPTTRSRYEQIALERAATRQQAIEGKAEGIQEMVEIYDNTTNYVFPQEGIIASSGTRGNEYYGALAAELIRAQQQAIEIKYEQEQIRENLAKISSGVMLTGTSYEMMTAAIDQNITSVLAKIERLRVQTDEMVKENYNANILPKISISSARYEVNAWGNPFINFVVIFVAIVAGIGLYRLIIRKKPFFDKMEIVRVKVDAIRKSYKQDQE